MESEKREKNPDPTLKLIMITLMQKKKTVRDLEAALGLSNGAVAKWSYSKKKPYERYLPLIADYLNVTEAYLLAGYGTSESQENQNMYEISPDELKVLEMYRELDTDGRSYMNQTLRYMLEFGKFRKILENGKESV